MTRAGDQARRGQCSPLSGDLRDSALAAGLCHAQWQEEYGSTSWDQYDFWANRVGRRAKAYYYRRPRLGLPLVAPFVLVDALVPKSRQLVWHRQRFPIADAHYAMGFLALARVLDKQDQVRRALPYLEALIDQRCPEEEDFCWGYPFDWETCFGTFREGTPRSRPRPTATRHSTRHTI